MKYYAISGNDVVYSCNHIAWMRKNVEKHQAFNRSVWGWCDGVSIVTDTGRHIEYWCEDGTIMRSEKGTKIPMRDRDRISGLIQAFEKRCENLLT